MDILQNAIDGKRVTSSSRRRAPVYNPATGEQIAEVPLSTADEVNAAVTAAKRAAAGWGVTPPLKRVQPMFRFKALLHKNAVRFGALFPPNPGKPTAMRKVSFPVASTSSILPV